MTSIHVVAAIVWRDGRILCAHRRSTAGGGPGGWEFPGGKVEAGESPEEALHREIVEELGCRLSTTWLLDTVEHDYPTFHLVMDCFVSELLPGEEPTASEHDELRWVGRDELLSLGWLAADVQVARTVGSCWDQIFASSHL